MNRFFLRSLGTIAILGFFLATLSCARNHDLEFISVTPGTETLGIACGVPGEPTTCAPTTKYRAFGTFIHPQETQEVTDQVQWTTSNPDLITFADPAQPNIMFPTGTGCGTGLQVQATLQVAPGNTKVGTATVSINCAGGGVGSGNTIDFSLSPNPGMQTVAPGGQANFNIQVVGLLGSPTVQLSVNPATLPAQISAFSLAPQTVAAGQSATLTLTASPTATAGPLVVSVQGSDASGGASTSVTLNVN